MSIGNRYLIALCLVMVMISACRKAERSELELQSFESPELAAQALVAALEENDRDALRQLLGPHTEALLSSGDEVADRNARMAFVTSFRSAHSWVAGSPYDVVLNVGPAAWPMPIPLVRRDSRWRFDGAAGAGELVSRRIGANELRTIDVMRGFVVAQEEYAAASHDDVPAGVYAASLKSDPGKRNGLYWKPGPGEQASPAGPFLAAAEAEGYVTADRQAPPYHGYRFRMLWSQGPRAEGGAFDYVENGKLTRGFALLAWPVAYGESGIMTFMVNQDGGVWQQDLGTETEVLARRLNQFNPDARWTPVR
jgi:hypothetical protein